MPNKFQNVKSSKKKTARVVFVFLVIILFSYKTLAFFGKEERDLDVENTSKLVYLNDNGLEFKINTTAENVSALLQEKNISISEHDQVIPEKNAKIFSGTNIEIQRAKKIKIQVDGKTMENHTFKKTVADGLLDSGVILTRLDKTSPEKNTPLENNQSVIVTRINEEEITVQEDIDFKITAKTDSKLGWREKKIETKGEKGVREVKYKVTYKNGKEISRVMLSKETIKEPVTQVETQGTLVKTGKAAKGQATWYAYQGGMYAASLTIPKGGYAKVTNTANGKSIIVQINDSGPYGKGRIIDLDKVAFQKIAALGAGVIGVKVEEVLN